ncbi:MAG: hypothetical protein R2799_03540 [Crocinitomicaceae bacterium]
MKVSVFILFVFLLYGCDSEEIILDFTALEIPPSRVQFDESIDSSIASIEEQYEMAKKLGYYMETDKKNYSVGEHVHLTLYNKKTEGSTKEFLYPNEQETERLLLSFSMYKQEEEALKGIRENLVSQKPAIVGDIFINNEGFYILTFTGLPKNVAKKLGYDPYEKVIFPGEELTIRLLPPSRPGVYVIYIFRHDHSGGGVGVWGLKKSIMSNIFIVG